MSSNIGNILINKDYVNGVDSLLDQWFLENDIPLEYRMSVPLMLVFLEAGKINGVSVIEMEVLPISNHSPSSRFN